MTQWLNASADRVRRVWWAGERVADRMRPTQARTARLARDLQAGTYEGWYSRYMMNGLPDLLHARACRMWDEVFAACGGSFDHMSSHLWRVTQHVEARFTTVEPDGSRFEDVETVSYSEMFFETREGAERFRAFLVAINEDSEGDCSVDLSDVHHRPLKYDW